MKVALVGNPNVGKSTFFNSLTGKHQHTGNWPGKTVEKKWGKVFYKGKEFVIVDLPGIYDLSAFSEEQKIARDFLLKEKPDAIINIVDASTLGKDLHLTLQLLEMGIPVVVVVNRTDIARRKGIRIDWDSLRKSLGNIPVIPAVATRGKGVKEALGALLPLPIQGFFRLSYGKAEKYVRRMESIVKNRWMAVKILEGDIDLLNELDESKKSKALEILEKAGDLSLEIASARFKKVEEIFSSSVTLRSKERYEKLDSFLLHPVLGYVFLFLILLLGYDAVFLLAQPFADFLQQILEFLSSFFFFLPPLFVEAIFSGMGNVVAFAPLIFFLFLFLAFLEDSGYIARATFLMNNIMRKLGLPGRAFFSLALGLGCNVPAIMATRTMERKEDRLITILVNSFIPCSARMAVFAYIAHILFPPVIAALSLLLLMAASFLAVAVSSYIFRRFLFPSFPLPLVMELPPYAFPTLSLIFKKALYHTLKFLEKAGTLIFLFSTLFVFLSHYPPEENALEQIGKFFTPLFSPLSFSWKESVALVSGFLAKEIVISTLSTLYDHIPWGYCHGFVFLLFTFLYIPCLATFLVIKQETSSWKLAFFSFLYNFSFAYILSFLVSRLCSFFEVF